MNPIVFKPTGDEFTAKKFYGRAAKEMAVLVNQATGDQGYRLVRPFPGVTIKCSYVFGERYASIHVEPTQEGAQEILEYKYLKIFVHADVINQEDWATELTDSLTREKITSSVAVGIVDINAGNLLWLGNVETEYLAVNGTGSWEGVYSGVSTEDYNDIIAWYNDLCNFAPYYSQDLPQLVEPWMDTAYSGYWLSANNMIELKPAYKCTTTYPGCELTTPAATGWCNDVFYKRQDDSLLDAAPTWRELSVADLYKNKLHDLSTEDEPCAVNSLCYFRYWPYGTNASLLPENPYEHDHTLWEEGYSAMGEITNLHWHWSHHSPILGELWNGLYSDYNREAYSVETGGIATVYHLTGKELRAFRVTGNEIEETSYTLPCYPTTGSTTPLDFLLNNIGEELSENYTLDDGFSWYFGMAGGLFGEYDSEGRQDGSSTVMYGNENFRTLIRVSAAYGIGALPWLTRDNDAINDSMAAIIKSAIVKAGGFAYENASIPILAVTDAQDFMLEHAGITPRNIREMTGVVYASPCLNIRVYAIPVK